jgi:hypothetical protein
MKNLLLRCFLAVVGFAPLLLRLLGQGLAEPVGLLSDATVGLLFVILALLSPYWLRVIMSVFWVLFQVASLELLAAMQRLPTWQDLQYLTDPDFVGNSLAGFTPALPVLFLLMLACGGAAVLIPFRRLPWRRLRRVAALIPALAGLHWLADFRLHDQDMAARYSPAHWFVLDGVTALFSAREPAIPVAPPAGLDELDLSGKPLIARGKAKNVLIVVLEGIPGLYYPEIARAIGTEDKETAMPKLAAASRDAMLIPDFTVHSHQTIRGLYSMLCGDYSKLSWGTPKALELRPDSSRIRECLPARLAEQGWSTHFLQGANLGFMSKDRIMPRIGFQHVHGQEWFTQSNPFPFEWGVVDEVFFKGAQRYIANLRARKKPWMLTLLTVGTHQPYAVSETIAERYPSRKQAAVALLDKAVADFLTTLRRKGVLTDTLVIITSDESHGSGLADWISSWGLGVVLAPEKQQLPRIKPGGYGLVDMTASVLDYLGLGPSPSIIGRSFFREYASPREMVSYTTSTRRWHTAGDLRYECADDGRCRAGVSRSLLGEALDLVPLENRDGDQLFGFTTALDHKLRNSDRKQVMQFAGGELRRLPSKMTSEWADNLIGAQYLDFPAKASIRVNIRYKAVETPETGVHLRLLLKQWEAPRSDIKIPEFPVLYAGEEGAVEFRFETPEAGQNFSFHLLGEGENTLIRMDEFSVIVQQGRG